MSPMPVMRSRGEGEPCDAGRNRRIDDRDARDQHQAADPDEGAVAEMPVPSIEVEIGEQEYHEGGGQADLGSRAPYLLVAGRDFDDLVEKAEVDADIGEHRPGKRRRRRKHRCPLDHEEDGQEQRQQAGDADHDAAVERVGIHRVLVGLGIPQIDLRQVRRGELGDEGDDRAGVERHQKHVGIRACLPVERKAFAGRDRRDAARSEIGPEQAGIHQAEMRRDDQPVELLVRRVGEREDRPVAGGPLVICLDLDAAHDAVGAGRRGHLEVLALVLIDLDRTGQVERDIVARNLDRLDRKRACGRAESRRPPPRPMQQAAL